MSPLCQKRPISMKRDLKLSPTESTFTQRVLEHEAHGATLCPKRPTSMKRDLQMRPIHTTKRPISM